MKSFNDFKISESLKKDVGRGGDCYSSNAKQFQIMDDTNNLVLVHGYVISQTQQRMKYDHCWIEDDDTVYDYSNGRKLKIPKMVYYSIGNIKDSESFKYNKKELNKMISKHKNWGPWQLKPKEEKI